MKVEQSRHLKFTEFLRTPLLIFLQLLTQLRVDLRRR